MEQHHGFAICFTLALLCHKSFTLCLNPSIILELDRVWILRLKETTLSEETLTNLKAVEYQWVRTMYVEGYNETEINHYIQTCFGGDVTFANLFRRVALQQESLYTLLQYVGCAPSSREF
ncbi:LOW QUALITY PROTEIN: hypothetical protein JCM19053_1203 [Vibrio sp. JCM 19053]|nr:LOW QUALITY PROTEIN: hypothetical protein JCM19053_1203 [Vibrio sp. JCM 19053]